MSVFLDVPAHCAVWASHPPPRGVHLRGGEPREAARERARAGRQRGSRCGLSELCRGHVVRLGATTDVLRAGGVRAGLSHDVAHPRSLGA
ncbi:hypothetical protein ACFPRL_07445 [Pseudoclavibacter helvolus]